MDVVTDGEKVFSNLTSFHIKNCWQEKNKILQPEKKFTCGGV